MSKGKHCENTVSDSNWSLAMIQQQQTIIEQQQTIDELKAHVEALREYVRTSEPYKVSASDMLVVTPSQSLANLRADAALEFIILISAIDDTKKPINPSQYMVPAGIIDAAISHANKIRGNS